MKIVIVGGPKTGKTTFADKLGVELKAVVKHADDLLETHDWSAASQYVSEWFDEPEPWIIEGVSTIRALRKWIAGHPLGKPCDKLIFMAHAFLPLSQGQLTMLKGCETVWKEVVHGLEARGVLVEYKRKPVL